jgi:hypothetical protein
VNYGYRIGSRKNAEKALSTPNPFVFFGVLSAFPRFRRSCRCFAAVLLLVIAFQIHSVTADAPDRTIAPYFTPATPKPKSPDKDGFIQRWLLLEPINKPSRTNTVFTGTYVRNALNPESLPNLLRVVPGDGEKVTVGNQELVWRALDSADFNIKLFRFAYGLKKPTYGVIFWAATVVNSPREMKNIRLAAGSNSASIWWVNGKEAVALFDDRRMVMDDAVSKRLTLNRGRNIICGAVINGPGLSDFCIRFIDENGAPIKDLTVTFDKTDK